MASLFLTLLLLLLAALCDHGEASWAPFSWLTFQEQKKVEDISHLPELVNVALGRPVVRSLSLQGDQSPALRSITDGFVHGKAKLGTALELTPEQPGLVVDLGRLRGVEEVLFYSELGSSQDVSVQLVSISLLDENGQEVAPTKKLRSLTKLFHWASQELIPRARYLRLTLADLDVPLAITEVEVYSPADPDDPQVPEAHKVQLLLTFFVSKSPQRAKEQRDSLVRNLRNPYIAGAHVLTESCEDFPFRHPKILQRCVGKQPVYGDFFQHANEHLLGRTVLLTNGDIVYTSSLAHVHRRLAPQSEFFVFQRWNYPCPNHERKKYEVFNFCEATYIAFDSYVFHPPVSRAVIEALDMPMNRWYAEHETMYHLIVTQGWNPTNPCVDLIGYHNHCSDLREWKQGIPTERGTLYLTHVNVSSASDEQPNHHYRIRKKAKNPDGSFPAEFSLAYSN